MRLAIGRVYAVSLIKTPSLAPRTGDVHSTGCPKRSDPTSARSSASTLAWYEEVLGRVESGAIVAPGEQERLTEEASAVAHLLDLLDSNADEPAS
jgi:hypothetical protein